MREVEEVEEVEEGVRLLDSCCRTCVRERDLRRSLSESRGAGAEPRLSLE